MAAKVLFFWKLTSSVLDRVGYNTNKFSLFEIRNLLHFSMFTQIEVVSGLLTFCTRDMTNLKGLKLPC